MSSVELRIGLVGDRNDQLAPHAAIPRAVALVAHAGGPPAELEWLPTERIVPAGRALLDGFAGLWCVPGSPYASMDGALAAVRFAREERRPFLGTCGGFQHTIIEYARDVLDMTRADHAESNPTAELPLMHRLACSLVGTRGGVRFAAGSTLQRIHGSEHAVERFNCSFGFNPAYAAEFAASDLRAVATDDAGELRAVELRGHPFFVATLYQPELSAYDGRVHPLIRAFLHAAAAHAAA
jgi:CTP synthase (UTP-ammonia lyase)